MVGCLRGQPCYRGMCQAVWQYRVQWDTGKPPGDVLLPPNPLTPSDSHPHNYLQPSAIPSMSATHLITSSQPPHAFVSTQYWSQLFGNLSTSNNFAWIWIPFVAIVSTRLCHLCPLVSNKIHVYQINCLEMTLNICSVMHCSDNTRDWQCTMRFPMSIDFLEIHICKN